MSTVVYSVSSPFSPIVSTVAVAPAAVTAYSAAVVYNLPSVFTSNYSYVGSKNGVDVFNYDAGIGTNEWPRRQVNIEMRDIFFNKFYEYSEILHLLKIVDGVVVVVKSSEEAQQNDISKDTVSALEQKKEYVRYNILTLSKNRKLLDEICRKNKLNNYDLPHNKYAVLHEQKKYIIKKLKQLRDAKNAK